MVLLACSWMRILLVDDDADVALVLMRLITHLGHEVEICTTPVEAVLKTAGGFDIIISDYLMSPVDGLDVLGAFAAAGTGYRILLTACQPNQDISVAMFSGVVHLLLTKPITLSELKDVFDAVGHS